VSGGYENLPTEGVDQLARLIEEHDRRLRELEKPSGSQLFETLANQVSPSVSTGSGTAFVVTTSAQNFASVSFTVPERYSRALVFAGASTTAGNSSDGRLFSYITIDDVAGPTSNATISASVLFGTCAAFSTRILTGLTPGASFAVRQYAYFSLGSTPSELQAWSSATIAAQVLFLV
jgi:hypothetical protein